MASWANLLATLVLASKEICMLNSKVACSRWLLNLAKVSFYQCWSFSSHWCDVTRLCNGISESIDTMSWSLCSTVVGNMLIVSVKLIARVFWASINAKVQFFLYSAVRSFSFLLRIFCAFSLFIVTLGGLMRKELGMKFSLRLVSYLWSTSWALWRLDKSSLYSNMEPWLMVSKWTGIGKFSKEFCASRGGFEFSMLVFPFSCVLRVVIFLLPLSCGRGFVGVWWSLQDAWACSKRGFVIVGMQKGSPPPHSRGGELKISNNL